MKGIQQSCGGDQCQGEIAVLIPSQRFSFLAKYCGCMISLMGQLQADENSWIGIYTSTGNFFLLLLFPEKCVYWDGPSQLNLLSY